MVLIFFKKILADSEIINNNLIRAYETEEDAAANLIETTSCNKRYQDMLSSYNNARQVFREKFQ